MPPLVPCFGCGGLFPDIEGPTHFYAESSPGCWAAYGEVLAREYSYPAYGRLHRLTVDTYAVQHPGRPGPQAIQSVAGHLISLYLILEQDHTMDQGARALGLVTQTKGRYSWLDPPSSRGSVTVADVQRAQCVEEHLAWVRQWAESAWQAWASHHTVVRMWVDELEAVRERK